jgi:LacI family transcriptional regulator
MKARSLPEYDQQHWQGDFSAGSGFRLIAAWHGSGQEIPEAIMCANDATAFGVMSGLREFGYDVPGSVAVTGFDDAAIARYTHPSITTSRQPIEEMSRAAVAAVMRAVGGGSRSQPDNVLPTELVVRESCGCTNRLTEFDPAAGALELT